MTVAIVIPAYNESQSIGRVVKEVTAYAHLVVVVDDGSRDNTGDCALAAGAIVLRHKINRGQGAALRTGIQYALSQGADVMVQFDADGQHQATELKRFIDPLATDQADVVLGSRFLDTKTAVPWTKKYFILTPALWFQRLTTGLRLTDVHNGFRAFNRHAASAIVIRQDRMAHASEIVNEIAHHRLRVLEVPVQVLYHEYGQGWRGAVRILRDLFIGKFIR